MINILRFLKYKELMFLGLLLFISSCSKEAQDSIPETVNPIIGDWDWFKSVTARNQYVTSPETEGYTLMLRFEANDSVDYYTDNTLTSTDKYEFIYRVNDPLDENSDSTLFLQIGNGPYALYSIHMDTLIISYAYLDGSTNYYCRKE